MQELHKLLQDLYEQKILPSDVAESLSTLPYQNLGFAKIDQHRSVRTGLPEVIYGEGKTEKQLISIIRSIWDSGNDVLATKVKAEVYKNIKDNLPVDSTYNVTSQTLVIKKHKPI